MIPKSDPFAFKIRAYDKAELARLYNPRVAHRCAMRKFNKWIQNSPGLWDQLLASGMTPCARQYTPEQVRLIVERLGAP